MKFSLGQKIVMLITVVAVILTGTCVTVSTAAHRKTIRNEYMVTADSMASTVAVTVDAEQMEKICDQVMEIYHASDIKLDSTQWEDPRYDSYLEQYLDIMEEPEYQSLQSELRELQEVSEVDCIYTVMICPEDETYIYLVDAAYDDELVTPGCIDPVDETCLRYLHDPEKGFPALVTNTPEYGWMVSSFVPIHNDSGKIVGYAAIDIDMNEIVKKEQHFLLLLTVILSCLTVVICVFAIFFVRKKIIKPINMLSEAAGRYGKKQATASQNQRNEFSTLNIHTGDELEILLSSMIQMEKDIDSYIRNLTNTKQQLSSARQQADDMHELAHKDSLTGIRNRMAYDKEVMQLEADVKEGAQAFGIAVIDLNFLKRINDECGHEYGNIAIKSLSQLVCMIFTHSPVFRIGGDEFAVILRNHDFEHIEQLRDEFNGQLEAFQQNSTLQPWEKISAALGYAVFDPNQDNCVDDVFKRADHNMYERKKAMKATRVG